MIYVSNAFSLQMVPQNLLGSVRLAPMGRPDLTGTTPYVSIVGHADTAAVLGVPFNRASVTLAEGDVLWVAQLMGGRLPEGATSLPEGFALQWVEVRLA